MRIRVHFRNEEVKRLYSDAGVKTNGSAGFDLVTVEDVHFEKMGEFKLI